MGTTGPGSRAPPTSADCQLGRANRLFLQDASRSQAAALQPSDLSSGAGAVLVFHQGGSLPGAFSVCGGRMSITPSDQPDTHTLTKVYKSSILLILRRGRRSELDVRLKLDDGSRESLHRGFLKVSTTDNNRIYSLMSVHELPRNKRSLFFFQQISLLSHL